MAPPTYAPFDVPGYVGALRRQGELLADAAQRAGLAAAAPSCPGWAVRDRLQVTGDPGIFAAFGRALQITWS